MDVVTVLGAVVGIWVAVAIVLALCIGRAIRIADTRRQAQLAMRPRRIAAPMAARAR